MTTLVRVFALVALLGLAIGCDDGGENKPYVEFAGGGFIFNYNLAQAYYGFVLRVVRQLPEGTVIEAEFENPAGGAAIVERRNAREHGVEYTFRTPPVEGVKADRDYRVVVRLIDPADGKAFASYDKAFRSSADQDILPQQPLTVGPGYQSNPESEYVNPPETQEEN